MADAVYGKIACIQRRGDQLQDQEDSGTEGNAAADDQEEALETALRKAEEKKKSRRYKAGNWFKNGEHLVSALTLLLVICTTVISAALWIAQQDANRINGRILAANERSSVYFGLIKFHMMPQPDNSVKEGVFVEIGNAGGSTTRGLKYRLACKPVSGPTQGDPFDRRALDKTETHYIALAPKQPNVTPQACALTSGELAIANVASLSLYVFGDATYEDTITPHVSHHVEFCARMYNFAFVGAVAAMSDFCPRHNCADDECGE